MTGLFEVFYSHSISMGQKNAFIFLEDGDNKEVTISYQELYKTTNFVAGSLVEKGLFQKTVLILYPPGLEYIKAFLACQAAGVIAVPIYPPRSSKHADRLKHIIEDCGASVILTSEAYKKKLESFDAELLLGSEICTLNDFQNKSDFDFLSYQSLDNVAFIQYTSGSTGKPKGVVVTSKNLLANEEQIKRAIHQDQDSVIVSWLPMYHDMGLIGNVLHNLYIGSMCVFFAPVHFLQNPKRWLRAISKYQATLSGAPNFAYDLLNKLDLSEEVFDLSSLEVAFNGSEKVRKDTLDTFYEKYKKCGLKRNAIYPCYGLAEATLMVSGYDLGKGYTTINTSEESVKNGKITHDKVGSVELVSSGKVRPGVKVVILNENGLECLSDEIGEIFISGSNVTGSYWNGRGKESFLTINEVSFVRTGDLGAISNNELYITGRKKEIIIRNGVNYYPYDLERLVSRAHDSLVINGCATFSIDTEKGEDVIIIAEVKRSHYRTIDAHEVFDAVNAELSEKFGFVADDIVLINPMSLPKTSSGKIRRSHCKELYTNEEFNFIASLTSQQEPLLAKKNTVEKISLEDEANVIIRFLRQIAENFLNGPVNFGLDTNIHTVGLDSLKLMQFVSELESELGVKMDINDVYDDIDFSEFIVRLKSAKSVSKKREARRNVSLNQEALWMGSQKDLTKNNIGFSFLIDGEISRDLIKNSLKDTLSSLNWKGLNFELKEGALVTTENPSKLIDEVHYASWDNLKEKMEHHFETPRNTEKDALIQLVLFSDKDETKTRVCLITHHIISDGWSLARLFESWIDVLKGGKPKEFGNDYQEFISSEEEVLENHDLIEQAEAHFAKQLEPTQINSLLFPIKERNSEVHSDALSFDRSFIEEIGKRFGLTASQLLLACYQMALYHLSSSKSICTVFPVSRRTSLNRQSMFGYLVNLAYFTSSFGKEPTLKNFFSDFKENYRNTLSYQEVPYAHLLRSVNVGPQELNELGHYYFAYQALENHSSFQKLFEKEGSEICEIANGVSIKSAGTLDTSGNFKMELEFFELENEVKGLLKFHESHFSKSFANELIEIIQEGVKNLATPGIENTAVCDFISPPKYPSILYGEEVKLNEVHFLDQFEKSVRDYADTIAVIQNEIEYTYLELDQLSDSVANNLRDTEKVQTDDIIGVFGHRAPEDIITIIGIMKAGAIYAPLDSNIPSKRLCEIVNESKIKYLISSQDINVPKNSKLLITNSLLQSKAGKVKFEYSTNAYIIYTSGTSGKPKGVIVNQKALVNLNQTMISAYDLSSADKMLQFASLSFDMSIEEIFPILSVGGSLVIRKEDSIDRLEKFIEFCEDHGISILNLPTSYWNETLQLDRLPKELRLIAVGGEKMNAEIVRQWFYKFSDAVELFNAYGPTEYTVNGSIKKINSSNFDTISVGSPVNNTQIFVQNSAGRILPTMIVGEIGLAGKGLAKYSIESNPNPFIEVDYLGSSPKKAYLTGDLGYCNLQGELIVLGRRDQQKKVRGYRVELEEVQFYLMKCAKVEIGIARVYEGQLYGFTLNSAVGLDELKEKLKSYLPAYMIPQRIIQLNKIPLTSRGKLDEKNLFSLVSNEVEEIILPKTKVEEQLLALWIEILGINEISVESNFFDLGGHSIKAVRLLSMVERTFDKKIGLKIFYQVSTIRGLADYLGTLNWMSLSLDEESEQDELYI